MSPHNDATMLRFRPLALGLLAACLVAPSARAAAPTPEPAITTTGVEGDYLRAIHRAIHFRWAVEFLEEVAAKRPPTDPLNNPNARDRGAVHGPLGRQPGRGDGDEGLRDRRVRSGRGRRGQRQPPVPCPADRRLRRRRRGALPLDLRPRRAPLLGRRGAPGRGAARRGAAASLHSGADQRGAAAGGPLHARRRRGRDVDVRARLAGAAAARRRARRARRGGAGPRRRRAPGRSPAPGAQPPRHHGDRGAGAGRVEGRSLRGRSSRASS